MVVVPGPIGRENQVALFHEKFLAIHRRISALALHDKSDRRHIVAVRPRHFAGIDDGKSHLQSMRGRFDRQMRAHQPDRAPLGLFDADRLARLEQAIEKRLPLP